MPTPIAHGVAAWATARTAEPQARAEAWLFVLVAFLAVAPDLDFLPGILVGQPGAFHRGPTHSLGGALVAAAATAGVLSRLPGRGGLSFARLYGLVMPVYCTHLVLDLVVPDTHGAAGIPLFWPLSGDLVSAPLPMPPSLRAFIDLQIGTGTGSFVGAILSARGLAVFLIEGLLFTPLLLAPKLIEGIRSRIPGAGSAAREQPEA